MRLQTLTQEGWVGAEMLHSDEAQVMPPAHTLSSQGPGSLSRCPLTSARWGSAIHHLLLCFSSR